MGFVFSSSELTGLLFSPFKLSEILKFGLDKLLSSEGSSVDEVDLESILGETKDGQWVPDALPAAAEGGNREQEEGSELGTTFLSILTPLAFFFCYTKGRVSYLESVCFHLSKKCHWNFDGDFSEYINC